MLSDFLRFFTITLNTFISCKRFMNIKRESFDLPLFLCISLPISAIMLIFHTYIPELDYIFLIICSYSFLHLFYKQDTTSTFFSSTFAVGFNLCIFALAIICNAPIVVIVGILSNYKFSHSFEIISDITIFIAHCIILFFFFRIKRFKNGLPYLNASNSNYVSFFVCLCAIIIYSFLGNNGSTYYVMSILVILLLLIAIFLYLWWKDQSKRKLNTSVIARQQLALESELEQTKKELNETKEQNEYLGSIIHRDNKIIPAMTYAIEQFLYSHPEDNVAKENLYKLKTMTEERKGILDSYDINITGVSHTGNIRIDSIVNYLYQKAKIDNIELDFRFEINSLESDRTFDNNICTLIADAVENAIIATKLAGNNKLLLELNLNPDNTYIKIYDSGIPFTNKALQNMGRFRYTTHKDIGGSGVGMMTTFEILRHYNASYDIDETIKQPPYTKCITITFDSKHHISHNGKLIR